MDVLQQPRNEHRVRMEPLAKLPVFWALEGKRVVIAGRSDAAGWKAELLAACGAEVHIYAERLSDTFEALVLGGANHPKGRFVHHARSWDATVVAGAVLAIADCETRDQLRHAIVFRLLTVLPATAIFRNRSGPFWVGLVQSTHIL